MGRTTFLLLFFICTVHVPGLLCDQHGSQDMLSSNSKDMWIPKGVPDKHDLVCTCHNQDHSVSHDTCCTCEATPIWKGKEKQLLIEYISVFGKAIAIHDQRVKNNNTHTTDVYKIEHVDKKLTEIPINICNNIYQGDRIVSRIIKEASNLVNITAVWPRIVNIDLSYNKLTRIGNIDCLTALDTLSLSYNYIEHISNKTFSSLTHIRTLKLDHNRIKSMDTFVFAVKTFHISHIDISENELKQLDVSNFMSVNPFCTLNFTGNAIESFTNLINMTLDTREPYVGGLVSLKGNLLKTFPNLQKLLNLDKMEQIGTVLNIGFDFRETSIGCDCAMEPYIEKAISFVKTYWKDYMDIKCDSPATLKGMSVVNVTLDDLVCNITQDKGCPHTCKCKDVPSKDTFSIDCANKRLKELPNFPVSNDSSKISLNMSGNHISSIRNVSYLDKLSNLDISRNQLTEITESAAIMLQRAVIDISDNYKITILPKVMQSRSLCSIRMNNIILECGCESIWMINWMDIKKCQNKSKVLCHVEGHGIMPAEDFREDMLDCSTKNLLLLTLSASMASLIITMIVSVTLLFQFRHEILVILLRLRQKKQNAIQPMFKYDAYLSYDTENDDLSKWVCITLTKYLEAKGYKLFLPMRDIPFGEVRSTASIDVLRSTRTFILILSESYLTQEDQVWTDNEWKYGWNIYKADSTKNMLLINYDHVSSFDVDHPQIKAFLRFGSQIDFLNPQRNILELISNKLGPVCSVNERLNAKQDFNPTHLFQVNNYNNKTTVTKHGQDTNENIDIFSEMKFNKLIKNYKDKTNNFPDNERNHHTNRKSLSDADDDDGREEYDQDYEMETETFKKRVWTVTEGSIKIKEKERPAKGTHNYWI